MGSELKIHLVNKRQTPALLAERPGDIFLDIMHGEVRRGDVVLAFKAPGVSKRYRKYTTLRGQPDALSQLFVVVKMLLLNYAAPQGIGLWDIFYGVYGEDSSGGPLCDKMSIYMKIYNLKDRLALIGLGIKSVRKHEYRIVELNKLNEREISETRTNKSISPDVAVGVAAHPSSSEGALTLPVKL